MSPQPEAVLDVQKYIGTCLISQKPRNRKAGRTKARTPGTGSGSGGHHPRKVSSSFQANSPPSVHAHGFSRCECCGQFRYGPGPPANPLVNMQWTGYPLYNLAGYKKKSAPASRSIKIPSPNGASQSEGELSPDSLSPPVLEDQSRLSKLAVHAHGAPLILTCKTVYNSGGGARNRPLHHSFIRDFKEGLALSEHGHTSYSGRNDGFGHRDGEGKNGLIQEDTAVLADGHFLRVLKPRKRRKRDRRVPESESGPKTLVTLEPYRPLCYPFNDGRGEGALTDLRRKDYEKDSGNVFPKCPFAASSLCGCNACLASPSPPLSPRSCSSSSLSPCSSYSSSSTESCSSLPSDFVSPFPTPPPSPLSVLGAKEPEEVISSAPRSTRVNVNGWETKYLASVYKERDRSMFPEKLTSNPLSQSEPKQSNTTFRPNVSPFTSTLPPARPWVSMHMPTQNQPACAFTVMCYNVLCDKYATREMYGYCPNWALNWEYRRKIIMDEIRHYASDIISLQEVETEKFYSMFLPELRKDGYDGIFTPKTRAKTMNETDRKYVDGCAIFFRTSKFRLIKDHLLDFAQLSLANASGSEDMINRVATKDNVGLVAVLETLEGAWANSSVPVDKSQVHQLLMVCTAHIHWDPDYCDVKLVQTMLLMHEIRKIIEETSRSFRPGSQKPNCNAIPLLLCGDFNSLPNSGVVEYLTSGRIRSDHNDLKKLGYNNVLQKLSTSEKADEYTHSLKIIRAYTDEDMPFTNYTFTFKGIIDYILHSETLKPTGLLGPLDLDWLRINKVVGCPHPHVPSDHLPLLVKYEMLAQQPPLTNGLVVQR